MKWNLLYQFKISNILKLSNDGISKYKRRTTKSMYHKPNLYDKVKEEEKTKM